MIWGGPWVAWTAQEHYKHRRPSLMHEYDLIADWYACERRTDTDAVGIAEVTQLFQTLPPSAKVLDVGCGHGLPLSKLLVNAGVEVLGVDSSQRMADKFRRNLPSTPVVCSPIQTAALTADYFDGAVSWGMMFHLNRDEQSKAVAAVAIALKTGGRFLFTSGDPEEDDPSGIEGQPMNNVPFHYWSFTREGYRDLLSDFVAQLRRQASPGASAPSNMAFSRGPF